MSKASLKEDSVGDVKVGELGFGSVAEGGSFIALPNADSVEIKLEGGVGSLPSVASKSKSTTIKESSVASKKSSKGGRDESKEGLVIGEGGEEDDAMSAKSGIVSVASLAAREGDDDHGDFEEKSNRREPSGVVGQGEDAFGMNSSVADGSSVVSAAGGINNNNNNTNHLAMDSTASANMIGAGSISSSVLEEERAKYKELARLHKEQHAAHVDEVERLTAMISDLSRRLQNARHTVDATKKVGKNSADTSQRFRHHIGVVSNALRLETAKNATIQRKKLHIEEAQRFESNKKKATKAHDDVRMAILDHSMTGMKRPTQKIIKMKKSIAKMEQEHESQKQLLLHLAQAEQLTEELAGAAQHGNLQKCLMCLKKGVSCNEVDTAGYLPLHYACTEGHADVAKLLLEYGADPSSYLTGHSPIEMAARAGYTDIVKMIIYFGGSTEDKGLRGSTPLVSAAGADHLETAVALLDAGADIQGNNLEENTALHVATSLESPVPMIRMLLKRGADIATVNRIGHTPVRMAVANANALAVDSLGGRAAMVDMKDEDLFVGDSVGADGDDDDDDDMAEPSLTDFGKSASLLEEGSQISALTVPGLATTLHQGSNVRAPR